MTVERRAGIRIKPIGHQALRVAIVDTLDQAATRARCSAALLPGKLERPSGSTCPSARGSSVLPLLIYDRVLGERPGDSGLSKDPRPQRVVPPVGSPMVFSASRDSVSPAKKRVTPHDRLRGRFRRHDSRGVG